MGVHVVREAAALTAACLDAARYKGNVLVERYVKGVEVDVAVLDGKALGAIEVVTSREFYDYTAKYTPGATQYFYPARLPAEQYLGVCAAAEEAHAALGCAGVTRIEFIVTGDGTPYVLEANTLPGMTATSLVPKIAAGSALSAPSPMPTSASGSWRGRRSRRDSPARAQRGARAASSAADRRSKRKHSLTPSLGQRLRFFTLGSKTLSTC